MFVYTIEMRNGSEFTSYEEGDLLFLQNNKELDGQFIIFTSENGEQVALPADDIASISCVEQEEEDEDADLQ